MIPNNKPKKPENPYPESIFKEPTNEQYRIIHAALKKEGLTLDGFSGSFCRLVWENCYAEHKKLLPSEDEIKEIIQDVCDGDIDDIDDIAYMIRKRISEGG